VRTKSVDDIEGSLQLQETVRVRRWMS